MRILFLGPVSPVHEYLESLGHHVEQTEEALERSIVEQEKFDWLISYGYSHIVPKDILDIFKPGHAINLHISYLPWNKGADPNLWSWIENSPKGVSIHLMDEGIDTGPIINRRLVALNIDEDTLSTSYVKLHVAMVQLFKDAWPKISLGKFSVDGNYCYEVGTFHEKKDRERVEHILTQGWDTPVIELKL